MVAYGQLCIMDNATGHQWRSKLPWESHEVTDFLINYWEHV